MIFKYILVIASSYLIGNINFALVISHFLKSDVRKMGSGNPGTMNMVRSFGLKMGILTLILDAAKGAVPALLGWFVLGSDGFGFNSDRIGIYLGGFCAIFGHIFPVLIKFKGGKGVATTIGIGFVANPIVASIVMLCGITFFALFKMGSVTSFLVIYSMIGIEGLFNTLYYGGNIYYSLMLFGIFMLTLLAHRSNIVRLLNNQERSIKVKK